jgi:hypothetical protein
MAEMLALVIGTYAVSRYVKIPEEVALDRGEQAAVDQCGG